MSKSKGSDGKNYGEKLFADLELWMYEWATTINENEKKEIEKKIESIKRRYKRWEEGETKEDRDNKGNR